jgi:hypothetical protein
MDLTLRSFPIKLSARSSLVGRDVSLRADTIRVSRPRSGQVLLFEVVVAMYVSRLYLLVPNAEFRKLLSRMTYCTLIVGSKSSTFRAMSISEQVCQSLIGLKVANRLRQLYVDYPADGSLGLEKGEQRVPAYYNQYRTEE